MQKQQALELLNEKINTFTELLNNSTIGNRWSEEYLVAYRGAEAILKELFSEADAEKFKENTRIMQVMIGMRPHEQQEYDRYKETLVRCIAELKANKERIELFWEEKKPTGDIMANKIPFISMSFDETDNQVNNYFTDILSALKIKYETGERYSKDGISEKVKKRITNSDLLIIIFVKRGRKEDGSFTTAPWLVKELGIAQGCGKEVIALVERGISEKEIANLNWEEELIYFDRTNIDEMEKATIKYLEALKEHILT
jgi:hypothetical protein